MGSESKPVTREDFLDWLRAHELDPDNVAEVRWTINSIWGHQMDGDFGACFDVTLYEAAPDGRRFLDPHTDKPATYTRRIPMRLLPGETEWAAASSSTPAPTTESSTSAPPSD
jgi:hypothetical protein